MLSSGVRDMVCLLKVSSKKGERCWAMNIQWSHHPAHSHLVNKVDSGRRETEERKWQVMKVVVKVLWTELIRWIVRPKLRGRAESGSRMELRHDSISRHKSEGEKLKVTAHVFLPLSWAQSWKSWYLLSHHQCTTAWRRRERGHSHLPPQWTPWLC